MKKVLLFCVLLSLSFSMVHAQSLLKPLQSDQTIHKLGLDTATNTGAVTQIIQVTGYQDLITFQTGVTKLTGTPGGVVKLYGSVDGVKYDYAGGVPDSLIVLNAAGLQVKTWVVSPSKFAYYKTVFKPTGTQTSTISTNALIRRK